MPLQTYPIPRFGQFANEKARLWLSSSLDLENWTNPQILVQEGCRANWTSSKRQIDPEMVLMDGKLWCFYKTSGSFGLLCSEDLRDWREIHPETPVFSKKNTHDDNNIENPCILQIDGEYVLFYSSTAVKRGIGMAHSTDLIHWERPKGVEFPPIPWAHHGPTAVSILDLRKDYGKFLMAFHGELKRPHHAAIGLAWSDNLTDWHLC